MSSSFTPYWSIGIGGTAASYDIQWRLEYTTPWTLVSGITGFNTTITVPGGGTYEWQIRSVNAYGTTAWSVSQFCSASGPPAVSVDVADLFFSPTAAFVDLTVTANRRSFYSATGGAVSLGANGSLPLGKQPPVFLTSNGTPATFAGNNGSGGPFAVTGGSLVASSTNPPGTSGSTVEYQTNTPGVGVVGDYLTGNLYAYNPDTLTDNGTQRRWMRRWRGLSESTAVADRYSSLFVMIQAGVGFAEGTSPHVILRWSDDSGYNWNGNRIQAVGGLGQTTNYLKFNRLGMTRRFGGTDRIFELSSTDAFPVVITGAETDKS